MSDDRTVVLEARVQLKGVRELNPKAASEAGFERPAAPPAGNILVISQFVHYHLGGGKFVRALCAGVETPA